MDDWGAFTSVGKKKKGKKADPEPIPPPPPEPVDLGASATADANPEDEWLGFSTGKKKKGAKKGKVCAVFLIWRCLRVLNDSHMQHPNRVHMCIAIIDSISQQIRRHKMPFSRFHIPITAPNESRDYPHTAAAKGDLARGVRRPDLRNLTQLACSMPAYRYRANTPSSTLFVHTASLCICRIAL